MNRDHKIFVFKIEVDRTTSSSDAYGDRIEGSQRTKRKVETLHIIAPSKSLALAYISLNPFAYPNHKVIAWGSTEITATIELHRY